MARATAAVTLALANNQRLAGCYATCSRPWVSTPCQDTVPRLDDGTECAKCWLPQLHQLFSLAVVSCICRIPSRVRQTYHTTPSCCDDTTIMISDQGGAVTGMS